jgi:nucleotide-binding universal stress UspA family protein
LDRIIVGFDGSPAARAALRWGVAEARLHRAVLAVWTLLDDPSTLPADAAPDLDSMVHKVRAAVDELTVGVHAEHHIEHGSAAAALVAYCRTG